MTPSKPCLAANAPSCTRVAGHGDERKQTLVKEMAHEKCTENCTSAHVRKYPLDLERVQAADTHTLLGQLDAPIKNKKGKATEFHSVLPIEFIAPKDMLAKLAAKPNVVKLRIVEYGPNAGKVKDVKLCLNCTEKECAANPGCAAKAAVKAYLYEMQSLKVGLHKVM